MGSSHSQSKLQTPLKRVRGLGPAKSGVHHWIAQRLTALALIPLCVWFVTLIWRFFRCETPLQMLQMVASPLNTVLFLTMISTMLYHGMLGMEVVIEDYVHCRRLRLVSMVLLYGVTLITAVAGISAVIMAHVSMLG
jgi:succinate dehydrogenase / fumarate reductase membrane anchor subunit